MAGSIHRLCTVSAEGDYWVAFCMGCSWVSEACDTKTKARRAHADHRLSEDLKKVS